MQIVYDHLNIIEIFDLKQLKKLFRHFSAITNLDLALYDLKGHEILAFRKKKSICKFAKNGAKCRGHITAGSLQSSELGGPYIGSCGCGLIMCFSSIMYGENLIGSMTCGPTMLWENDETAIKEFHEKTQAMSITGEIDKLLHLVPSCSRAHFTSSAQILYTLVSNLTKEHSEYLRQQARITEEQTNIAEYTTDKNNLPNPDYPIELEKELLTCMQCGNTEKSREILNTLLGEIFIFADGDRVTIKVRLFELISLFSRAAVISGSPISEINLISRKSYHTLHDAYDFEEICFLAIQSMEEFTMLIERNRSQKSLSEYLSRAVDYIENNYANTLTLKKIADIIFINAFYLSHLFRKEMNTTFSEYLCKTRIEKAKDLLKNKKNLRIHEIAEKTGFNDPNYFAKTFHKIAGATPREYKKFFR